MQRVLRAGAMVMGLAAAGAAGCGGGNNNGMDAGGGPADAYVPDTYVPRDTGTDAFNPCMGVTCTGLTHCVMGSCVSYPPCLGDGTCPTAGDVCTARLCIPGTDDPDGDGSPAAMDCDETNAMRSPLLPEICDPLDNDCDMLVDEGDPAALCESNPVGGICIMHACGCPSGTFDIDHGLPDAIPGCECVASPAVTDGLACTSAIDLGTLSDTAPGTSVTLTGNVLPDDREVWYSFTATDDPDTSCDLFHVRVLMTVNPADTFEFTVFKGDCGTMVACTDAAYQDFSWGTDLMVPNPDPTITVPTGQCPCVAGVSATVNSCVDDTSVFYVRVRRKAGSARSCSSYTLEISNGVYRTM